MKTYAKHMHYAVYTCCFCSWWWKWLISFKRFNTFLSKGLTNIMLFTTEGRLIYGNIVEVQICLDF